jgi:hypothetical protein
MYGYKDQPRGPVTFKLDLVEEPTKVVQGMTVEREAELLQWEIRQNEEWLKDYREAESEAKQAYEVANAQVDKAWPRPAEVSRFLREERQSKQRRNLEKLGKEWKSWTRMVGTTEDKLLELKGAYPTMLYELNRDRRSVTPGASSTTGTQRDTASGAPPTSLKSTQAGTKE